MAVRISLMLKPILSSATVTVLLGAGLSCALDLEAVFPPRDSGQSVHLRLTLPEIRIEGGSPHLARCVRGERPVWDGPPGEPLQLVGYEPCTEVSDTIPWLDMPYRFRQQILADEEFQVQL